LAATIEVQPVFGRPQVCAVSSTRSVWPCPHRNVSAVFTGSVAWAGVISRTVARAEGCGVLFTRPHRFRRRSRKRNKMTSDDEAFRIRFRKSCTLDTPRRRLDQAPFGTSCGHPVGRLSNPTGNVFPVAMTKGMAANMCRVRPQAPVGPQVKSVKLPGEQ
jgi:hypothetical protein